MNRLTYRYVTKAVEYGSPTWKAIENDLKAAGVYWFLTDPYYNESVAAMVYSFDEEKFLEVVNKTYVGEFYERELI